MDAGTGKGRDGYSIGRSAFQRISAMAKKAKARKSARKANAKANGRSAATDAIVAPGPGSVMAAVPGQGRVTVIEPGHQNGEAPLLAARLRRQLQHAHRGVRSLVHAQEGLEVLRCAAREGPALDLVMEGARGALSRSLRASRSSPSRSRCADLRVACSRSVASRSSFAAPPGVRSAKRRSASHESSVPTPTTSGSIEHRGSRFRRAIRRRTRCRNVRSAAS